MEELETPLAFAATTQVNRNRNAAMKHTRRRPCGNCPFLRSAPLGHWAPDHYVMLANMERDGGELGTSKLFACHKDKAKPKDEIEPCVGWLLDQRRTGVRNIQLRMLLIGNDEALEQFEEAEGDEDCYESVGDVVAANLGAILKSRRA